MKSKTNQTLIKESKTKIRNKKIKTKIKILVNDLITFGILNGQQEWKRMIEERKKEHVPSNTSTHKQQHALPHARCFDVFNVVAEVIVWILFWRQWAPPTR